jgi:hypothetical protein
VNPALFCITILLSKTVIFSGPLTFGANHVFGSGRRLAATIRITYQKERVWGFLGYGHMQVWIFPFIRRKLACRRARADRKASLIGASSFIEISVRCLRTIHSPKIATKPYYSHDAHKGQPVPIIFWPAAAFARGLKADSVE